MRHFAEVVRTIRSFTFRKTTLVRGEPGPLLVAIAAFQTHVDLCGMDAMRKHACESCGGRTRLHTIWPDGNYYCLHELVWHWPSERHGLGLEACGPCARETLHVTGFRDRRHCVQCWMNELKRLADNVGGIAVEHAVARRATLSAFNNRQPASPAVSVPALVSAA